MNQHLKDFARHLVNDREGAPVAVSTVVAVFLNLGNALPGTDLEAQVVGARTELAASPDLAYTAETDTLDTRNDGEGDEDWKARREVGLRSLEKIEA